MATGSERGSSRPMDVTLRWQRCSESMNITRLFNEVSLCVEYGG